MSDGPFVLRREMGYSKADFLRLLPKGLADRPFDIIGDRIVVDEGARRLEIELGIEGERRIALLALPILPVTMTFSGYDDGARTAFLDRFDLAYRKGGG